MKLKLYQVDAFTSNLFSGNPAAVCPLEQWLPDEVMQNIAMENNLAETAFYVHEKDGYRIRWFTPAVEVDLCGHATLAAAFVLFNCEGFSGEKISFNSRSGMLTVAKNKNLLTLDFPADILNEVPVSHELTEGFNILPHKAFKGKTDYLFVYENEEEVLNIAPDFRIISKLNARGIIVTSKGKNSDLVSRFFAPQCGIDEDPVTGSTHTTLAPFWAKQLGKNEMSAIQLSKRKGFLQCQLLGERVLISGEARLYLAGQIMME